MVQAEHKQTQVVSELVQVVSDQHGRRTTGCERSPSGHRMQPVLEFVRKGGSRPIVVNSRRLQSDKRFRLH